MRILGVSPGDYKDFKPNNPDIKVEDGTLTINNIQKNNEGYYLCEANNGIGSGLSAVILISVQGEFIFLNFFNESYPYFDEFPSKRHHNLRSNRAIKPQGEEMLQCYSAKLKGKNQLESCGTSTTNVWTLKATTGTPSAKKFCQTECYQTSASKEQKGATQLCSLALPLTLSEATIPVST